jgi:endonuclease III
MPKRSAARRATPKPSKPPAVTRRIFDKLSTQHPNADTELHYSNPYELLVATILSAQCTDERVNQVTPALFRRYPDARTLAKATAGELEPQIQSTGFFRAKSRSLLGMATEVVERHHGEIPNTMEELTALPGVGRKTANVVLGHALGVPGLPVDRHVLRVVNRIGIARSEDPEVVEQQLTSALPPEDWTRASDTLILHGRRICKPRPLCDRCAVRDDCNFFAKLHRIAVKRGSSGEVRQAAKLRGAGRGGEVPPQSRTESGSSGEVRRAAKLRGTGRGGGAPRQTKK